MILKGQWHERIMTFTHMLWVRENIYLRVFSMSSTNRRNITIIISQISSQVLSQISRGSSTNLHFLSIFIFIFNFLPEYFCRGYCFFIISCMHTIGYVAVITVHITNVWNACAIIFFYKVLKFTIMIYKIKITFQKMLQNGDYVAGQTTI